ncbi:MAG TPA: xanthine dehydrogenase family protein subunit M [Solirubrobacteraceae bacterium]
MSDPQYFAPDTVDEAVRLLSEHPGARPIAGGTDLVVATRGGRKELPEALVALHRLAELRDLGVEDDALRLSALVTQAQIAESEPIIGTWTALSDAARLVGSPATRATATIGGNLMNASPAQELGSPLLVHGAQVELLSTEGARTIGVDELWLGPGRTATSPGELLTKVVVPRPQPGSASAYLRLEYRQAMEIAVVGAAALLTVDGGQISQAAVALTAVAPTCILVEGVDELLADAPADAAPFDAAAELAAAQAQPISDVRASAEYRRAQVMVIVERALRMALRRAPDRVAA